MEILCAVWLLVIPGCDTTPRPAAAPPRGGVLSDLPDDFFERAAERPVPAGNVRITIDRLEVDHRDREAYAAAIQYRDRTASLRVGGRGPAHGLRVFGARRGVVAALSASTRFGRTTSRQFLLLVPGSTGSLDVVQMRPRPYVVVVPVYRGAVVVSTVEHEVTGSAMHVTVHRADAENVDLELRPYFHGARDDGDLRINELSTRVLVPAGQPVVLMADRTSSSSLATQILSHRSESRQSEVIVVVTADVGAR